MLSMTRWNPFEELTSLHREMDRVFGRYVGDERAGTPATAWIPATEVDAGDDGWKIRVGLPGIAPKDVHIDLHGNRLSISGQRERIETNERESTSEFHYGRFERAFTLPANIDAEKVVASFDNGMLELSLPLAEAAKPRRIAIGGGDSGAGA